MAKKKATEKAKTAKPAFRVHTREFWQRSKIKIDPKNPRYIDPTARAKIRDGIKRYGVSGIIVDRNSCEVVGGHQRLSCLDEIAAGGQKKPVPDYQVPVEVVEMTDDDRARMNVLLNNPGAQGSFDMGKLESICLGFGKTFGDGTGLTRLDLDALFAGKSYDLGIFGLSDAEAAEKKSIEGMKEDAKRYERGSNGSELRSEGRRSEDGNDEAGSPASTDENGDAQAKREAENARLFEKRLNWRQQKDADESPDYILHVVFQNEMELTRFLQKTGVPEDEQYIDGRRLADACGVDLEPEADRPKKRKSK